MRASYRNHFRETYKLGDHTQAVRVEHGKRIPCWHCSKLLYNRTGGISPPYVGYRAHILGHDRVLHRTCAENLGLETWA